MIDIAKIRDDYSLHPSRAEPEIPGLCDEIERLRAACDAKEAEIQRVWKNYQTAKCSVMELTAIISHVECFLPTFAKAECSKVCEKARTV